MRRAVRPSGGLPWYGYAVLCLLTAATLCLCVSLGSVARPPSGTQRRLSGMPCGGGNCPRAFPARSFWVCVCRACWPRRCAAARWHCAARPCRAAAQPFADGSTLGVSAGASLGAVTALLLGISFPGLPFAGTMVMAMLFALGSLILILSLAYAADRGMSTQTIILMGVVLSMFVTSIISLLTAFSGEKLRFHHLLDHGLALGCRVHGDAGAAGCAGGFWRRAAFPCGRTQRLLLGEDAARHMGVAVRPVKLCVLICVASLIGICVSVGGSIGFVGLIVPHAARLFIGANHRRVLPLSVFMGAIFLMLADLLARTVVSPIELPIGVVTSLVGAVVFVVIFFRRRRLCWK